MVSLEVMDKIAPGGVYLCQVNENVSCGACCGLYNITDLSREKLHRMLSERSAAFLKIAREIDAIIEFGENTLAAENETRPYPEFYHCPYIGFIGNNGKRVGCLLHPAAEGNNSVDYRGLSYYGSMTCNIYFCPSYTVLSDNFKRVIRTASQDWYSYGLIITENALINAFLSETEKIIQRKPDEKDVRDNPDFADIIRDFIGLKPSWPFRPVSDTPANYFFNDKLYDKKDADYTKIRSASFTSLYNTIFKELGSSFQADKDIRKAENMIEFLLKRLKKYNKETIV
ncbi:MAG: hypothetical protein KJ826_18375 [Proteobacteria bacterium]|nr:hypothetical protein [Pseudomonadota bacterium]MBU4035901.1 hypothetical protein [Pseudomonadota bacterium]